MVNEIWDLLILDIEYISDIVYIMNLQARRFLHECILLQDPNAEVTFIFCVIWNLLFISHSFITPASQWHMLRKLICLCELIHFNIVTCMGVHVTKIMSSALDDWIVSLTHGFSAMTDCKRLSMSPINLRHGPHRKHLLLQMCLQFCCLTLGMAQTTLKTLLHSHCHENLKS
jgi:hypothetical protein